MPTQLQNGADMPFKGGNGRTRSSLDTITTLFLEGNPRKEAHFKLRNTPLKRPSTKQSDQLVMSKAINVKPGKRLRVEGGIDSDPPMILKNLTKHPKQLAGTNSMNDSSSSTTRSRRNTSRVSGQSGQEIKNLDEDKELKKVIEIAKRNRKISFSHQPKSESFAKKLAAAIATRIPSKKSLKKLKLRNCVTSKFLEIFSRGIDSREVTVAKLDLSGNKNLDIKAVKKVMEKLHSEALDLSDAEFDEEQIDNLANMKVKVLTLNYTSFANDSISDTLVKLINNGLEELSLIDSSITDLQLEKISKRMKINAALRILDLSHVSLGRIGILAVAAIVNKTKEMDRLVLSDCDLTTECLVCLEKEAENKIAELDVSSNHELVDGDIVVVAVLVDKVDCRELDLSSNMITGEHIEQLLTARGPKNIKSLLLCENPGIASSAVGRLVVTWRLKSLDLSECRRNVTALAELDKSMDSYKLQRLDVSDSQGIISDEKRKALKLLSRKTEELRFEKHK